MKALLMCGGKGTRLGMGEKPLVTLAGRKLIEYVLDELWICEDIFAATTRNTPRTEKFLKREGVEVVRTSGAGYIEDMVEALRKLSIAEPVLIISADLFIVKNNLLSDIIDYYNRFTARALQTAYYDGAAAGINILDGMFLDEEQEEVTYRISRKDVVNINTPEDLKKAEMMIYGRHL
jgi:adenosylcobinamide-phosphate guanylyltransferase